MEAGGTSFQYIKALNATRDHVALMIALIEERLFERELRGAPQNTNKFQQV